MFVVGALDGPQRDDPARTASLPACRDPDDQKFLALAAACGARVLLTKDLELLRLARRVPFAIVPPAGLPGQGLA